jgi:hypothetical protein
VEFWLDNRVALWMFAADQLRHLYS